jgi:hypothetical protein
VMKPITYSLHFPGRASSVGSERIRFRLTAPSAALATSPDPPPINRRQPILNRRARRPVALQEPQTKGDVVLARHVLRLATVSVLAAAILAPAASAGRYSITAPPQQKSQPVTTCHQYCRGALPSRTLPAASRRSLVRTELVSISGGFHWADAAIGFAIGIGGALVILVIQTGRRTRVRHAQRREPEGRTIEA